MGNVTLPQDPHVLENLNTLMVCMSGDLLEEE